MIITIKLCCEILKFNTQPTRELYELPKGNPIETIKKNNLLPRDPILQPTVPTNLVYTFTVGKTHDPISKLDANNENLLHEPNTIPTQF
jgi:hypothetical protein